MKTLPILAFALACPSLAAAQPPAPASTACPARDADLTGAVVAWRTAAPAGASIQPGHTLQVELRPAAEVQAAVPPHSPQGGGPAMAARLDLDVPAAGTYALALDSPAWVDLVRDGQSLRPVARGRGPACSSIYRTVDFQLAPGRYIVQLSGTAAASIRLLVFPR